MNNKCLVKEFYTKSQNWMERTKRMRAEKASKIEEEMNKWWRIEDNYLHGFRCQLVSPGWGGSSKRESRKGKLQG